MMLITLFLSCMVAGSLACSDESCKDPKLANELLEIKFLPNKEQLGTLCPKIISFLECEKDFFECQGQSLEELAAVSDKSEAAKAQAMLSGMSLVRDLCNEDSSFHKDYVASVECFKGYISIAGRMCLTDIAAPLEAFFDEIYPDKDEITEQNENEIRCLNDALHLACIIDNLGDSCGSVAQRTAMTVLERMKAAVKANVCGDLENAADLKEKLLDFLELSDEKRSSIKSVFDLVKRRR